jgi:hypothetical protein
MGCSSRIRIPDADLAFFPSRIRGSKRLRIPDPQHCFLITGFFLYKPSEIQAEYVHEVVDAAGAPHRVQATPLVHHNCLERREIITVRGHSYVSRLPKS